MSSLKFTGQVLEEKPNGCTYEIVGEKSRCDGFRKGTRASVQRWLSSVLQKINARHKSSVTASAWCSPKEKRRGDGEEG